MDGSYAIVRQREQFHGLLTLTGLNAQFPQNADGFGYYPIDSRRVIASDVDGQQLGLLFQEGIGQAKAAS
jgi:hypothetical protein